MDQRTTAAVADHGAIDETAPGPTRPGQWLLQVLAVDQATHDIQGAAGAQARVVDSLRHGSR